MLSARIILDVNTGCRSRCPRPAVWCLFALSFLVGSPLLADATTQPAPAVRAAFGIDGRWPAQQWAPLRLWFVDPGPVARVEVFCDDAGPVFRAATAPAPAGTSYIDVQVYTQVASSRWSVRLTNPGGAARTLPLDLDARFELLSTPMLSTRQGALLPWQMLVPALARAETTAPDDRAAAYLATGRALAAGPDSERQMPETFGPPADWPLVDVGFYEHVWTWDLAQWPARTRALGLAGLVAALLAVALVALLIRRAPWAALLAGAILLIVAAGAAAALRQQGSALVAEMTLITRPGNRTLIAGWPVPVRTQRWLGVAAYHSGATELPPLNPTPRVVVTRLREPATNVELPATFMNAGREARVTLNAGNFRALLSTDYNVSPSRMTLTDATLRWHDWQPALSHAWLVHGAQATPLNVPIAGDGELDTNELPSQPWAQTWQPHADDSIEMTLARRMIRYAWSSESMPRGERRWLVGLTQPRSDDDVVRPPAVVVVDLE